MKQINLPNRKLMYKFQLKAKTALFIGESEHGKILRDANNAPFIPGNSIGGALRNYLVKCGIAENNGYFHFLGGEKKTNSAESNELTEFIESKLYISHGTISATESVDGVRISTKEGTRIDPKYGSALPNHKYSMEYLIPGFSLCFLIEYDATPNANEDDNSQELSELVKLWARAIHNGEIRFGGKKSNDFGCFEISSLEQKTYVFDKSGLDEYIFKRHINSSNIAWKKVVDWKSEPTQLLKPKQTMLQFALKGQFPYGVYQSFKLKDLHKTITGVQKRSLGEGRFIPSSSMKGLLRQQFNLLVRRMLNQKPIENNDCKELFINKITDELFGGIDRQGQLVVSDMIIEHASPVHVRRTEVVQKDQDSRMLQQQANSDREANNEATSAQHPTYIKIDRLTGSVLGSLLKQQYEVAGETSWTVQLLVKGEQEQSPFIFPILYIMRQIGLGKVPIGGRTVIGVGQLEASSLELIGMELPDLHSEVLSKHTENQLRLHYQRFVEWIEHELNLQSIKELFL